MILLSNYWNYRLYELSLFLCLYSKKEIICFFSTLWSISIEKFQMLKSCFFCSCSFFCYYLGESTNHVTVTVNVFSQFWICWITWTGMGWPYPVYKSNAKHSSCHWSGSIWYSIVFCSLYCISFLWTFLITLNSSFAVWGAYHHDFAFTPPLSLSLSLALAFSFLLKQIFLYDKHLYQIQRSKSFILNLFLFI